MDSSGYDGASAKNDDISGRYIKERVLFKNLVFVVKPLLFSPAIQFGRSPVLLVV